MTVIDNIRESIISATGLPFYYDTPQTLNVRLDTAIFPCALLHILESNAVVVENGSIKERLTVEVLFTQQSNLDFDGADVERTELSYMKEAAFTWLLWLMRKSDTLRLVSLNSTHRYYATDDAIFSAYGVNITIEEKQGISKCTITT